MESLSPNTHRVSELLSVHLILSLRKGFRVKKCTVLVELIIGS